MILTTEQLSSIVARALPDERLRDARALAADRYRLILAGGERLLVQVFGSAAAAATAAEALRLLRGEFDLPLPQLRASDADGATVGVPYLLIGELSGEPLTQVLPQFSEDQLYQLGRQLGDIMYRVHRLGCEQYGSLDGDQVASGDERGYVLERLARDIQSCGASGLLDPQDGEELTEWFERNFKPAGRQPALVHGALSMDRLLVRQSRANWQIAGLLGWDSALGWSPAWDHVTWLDATDDPRCFGLRVGYGNAYDEKTARTYEQVREHALAPYRMLLLLQRMREASEAGQLGEATRRREVLRRLVQVLDI
jgi:aminoglycoside phosphotransferase (APT) family kinase protein